MRMHVAFLGEWECTSKYASQKLAYFKLWECTSKYESENACSISGKEILALELKVTFSSMSKVLSTKFFFN
jgi:hypothetical protein